MIFDDIVARLNRRTALPLLNPLQPFDVNLSRTIRNANLPGLLICGLLVWNDDIAAAHPIAQAVDGVDGSYWHAIIHRREGDYWNSKYWFRLVGNHPVQAQLAGLAEAKPFLKKGKYMAGLMVDACEKANANVGAQQPTTATATGALADAAPTAARATASPAADDAEALQRLQLAEIKALLDYCSRLPAN